MATIGYSVTAGIAAIAIASLVVRSEAGAGGWLANPALRRAGTLSYGAYLYHLPLITLCLPIRARIMSWSAPGQILTLAGHVLWISIMFALTLLTAAVSYRLIEQPFLSLKNRKPRAERVPHVGWAAGVESV
jgi:peptidoglycan/LPS O-acetylase OafA/YrhL